MEEEYRKALGLIEDVNKFQKAYGSTQLIKRAKKNLQPDPSTITPTINPSKERCGSKEEKRKKIESSSMYVICDGNQVNGNV